MGRSGGHGHRVRPAAPSVVARASPTPFAAPPGVVRGHKSGRGSTAPGGAAGRPRGRPADRRSAAARHRTPICAYLYALTLHRTRSESTTAAVRPASSHHGASVPEPEETQSGTCATLPQARPRGHQRVPRRERRPRVPSLRSALRALDPASWPAWSCSVSGDGADGGRAPACWPSAVRRLFPPTSATRVRRLRRGLRQPRRGWAVPGAPRALHSRRPGRRAGAPSWAPGPRKATPGDPRRGPTGSRCIRALILPTGARRPKTPHLHTRRGAARRVTLRRRRPPTRRKRGAPGGAGAGARGPEASPGAR